MSSKNNTTRFSDRVSDYRKFRPHYPNDIVIFLQDSYGITPQDIVADIGAGTGISSRLFLENGYKVLAVEPNAAMRKAAVDDLRDFEKFSAIQGTAEHTSLPDGTVNIIVAAQAFHWFDVTETRKEFSRILMANGLVVLIWNERLTNSAFEAEYDTFIVRHAIDYVKVDHRNIDYAQIKSFFAPHPCALKVFSNHQDFDFGGLKGRLLSSSYMPQAGSEGYSEMIADLKLLFDRHCQQNAIRINYNSNVYVGRWNE
jgi:ubiquinone/menaquinone biosynthesis C-methylase UbiE